MFNEFKSVFINLQKVGGSRASSLMKMGLLSLVLFAAIVGRVLSCQPPDCDTPDCGSCGNNYNSAVVYL